MKLPNPNEQQRPTPRFGGVTKLPDTSGIEAEGSRAIGSSIQGLGDSLLKMEIRDDKYAVEDATTRLQQKRLELSKGDNGFVQTRGGGINDKFHGEHMSRYDSAAKEIGDSLGTDRQREMFGRRASLMRVAHGEDLINHVTKERNLFAANAYKAGISSGIDVVNADFDSEYVIKSELERTKQLTKMEIERLDLDGNKKGNKVIRDLMYKTNESNIHESVINQALANQQYAYAQDYYTKNENKILGERQDDIKDALRVSGLKTRSQDLVSGYFDSGMTETEASAQARKDAKGKGDLQQALLDRIKTRYGENNAALDRAQKAVGEEVRGIYQEGIESDADLTPQEAYDLIPETMLKAMDQGERIALYSKMKSESSGSPVKTDPATYYALRMLYTSDPIKFRDPQQTKLMQYVGRLSTADFEEMVKLQTDPVEMETARTKNQILVQGAVAAGLEPGEANDDGDDGDKVRAYYERVDSELRQFQETTGKKPSPDEVREISDRLAIKVLRKDAGWFWFDKEQAAGTFEIPGVPTDMIDELAADLNDRGAPVDEANILNLYNWYKNNPDKILK